MMALTLSVPCADWFTPCEKQVTLRGLAANSLKNRATSFASRPVAAAVAAMSGAIWRARASASAKPVVLALDVRLIEPPVVGEMHQQAAEQRGVGARRDRQEQIGVVRRHGAARIDHDQLGAAVAPVAHHALEQHRMAPRRVRADQHDQVGEIEVLVVARHDVARRTRGDGRPRVDAMQSRELVSTLAEPRKPFISLLAT